MTSLATESSTLDRVFDILSNATRRHVLLCVSDASPRSGDVFTPENLAPDGSGPDPQTTTLYHTHLPKLDAAGYVDWNTDTRTIRRGPRLDEIVPLLRLVLDHEDDILVRES